MGRICSGQRAVMIDIETYGTKADAVVLSIGAVKFNRTQKSQGDKFYKELDMQSQIVSGRSVDGKTLSWWASQDTPPPAGFENPKAVLEELAHFCNNAKEFWFRGPTFDAIILEDFFRKEGVPIPWKFWEVKDVRTLDIFNINRPDKKPVEHNALIDCEEQIKDVLYILEKVQK